jgi:hypothetical protein
MPFPTLSNIPPRAHDEPALTERQREEHRGHWLPSLWLFLLGGLSGAILTLDGQLIFGIVARSVGH